MHSRTRKRPERRRSNDSKASSVHGAVLSASAPRAHSRHRPAGSAKHGSTSGLLAQYEASQSAHQALEDEEPLYTYSDDDMDDEADSPYDMPIVNRGPLAKRATGHHSPSSFGHSSRRSRSPPSPSSSSSSSLRHRHHHHASPSSSLASSSAPLRASELVTDRQFPLELDTSVPVAENPHHQSIMPAGLSFQHVISVSPLKLVRMLAMPSLRPAAQHQHHSSIFGDSPHWLEDSIDVPLGVLKAFFLEMHSPSFNEEAIRYEDEYTDILKPYPSSWYKTSTRLRRFKAKLLKVRMLLFSIQSAATHVSNPSRANALTRWHLLHKHLSMLMGNLLQDDGLRLSPSLMWYMVMKNVHYVIMIEDVKHILTDVSHRWNLLEEFPNRRSVGSFKTFVETSSTHSLDLTSLGLAKNETGMEIELSNYMRQLARETIAATAVQRIMRGFLVRREMEPEMARLRKRRHMHKAAELIQAWFRGYRVRHSNLLENKRRARARHFDNQKKTKLMRQYEEKARMLQKQQREIEQAMNQVKTMSVEEVQSLEYPLSAYTRVGHEGHLRHKLRSQNAKLREYEAATKIQSAWLRHRERRMRSKLRRLRDERRRTRGLGSSSRRAASMRTGHGTSATSQLGKGAKGTSPTKGSTQYKGTLKGKGKGKGKAARLHMYDSTDLSDIDSVDTPVLDSNDQQVDIDEMSSTAQYTKGHAHKKRGTKTKHGGRKGHRVGDHQEPFDEDDEDDDELDKPRLKKKKGKKKKRGVASKTGRTGTKRRTKRTGTGTGAGVRGRTSKRRSAKPGSLGLDMDAVNAATSSSSSSSPPPRSARSTSRKRRSKSRTPRKGSQSARTPRRRSNTPRTPRTPRSLSARGPRSRSRSRGPSPGRSLKRRTPRKKVSATELFRRTIDRIELNEDLTAVRDVREILEDILTEAVTRAEDVIYDMDMQARFESRLVTKNCVTTTTHVSATFSAAQPHNMCFLPAVSTMLITDGGSTRLIDIISGDEITDLMPRPPFNNSDPHSITTDPRTGRLYILTAQGVLYVWDGHARQFVLSIQVVESLSGQLASLMQGAQINLLQVCPVTSTILINTSAVDRCIRFYEPVACHLISKISVLDKIHLSRDIAIAEQFVHNFIYLARRNLLIVTSRYIADIFVINTASAQVCAVMRGHRGSAPAIVYIEELDCIVSGGAGRIRDGMHRGQIDSELRLWGLDAIASPNHRGGNDSHAHSSKLLTSQDNVPIIESSLVMTGHKDRVTSIVFLRQAELIVSSSLDHTIRFWNLDGEPYLLTDPKAYRYKRVWPGIYEAQHPPLYTTTNVPFASGHTVHLKSPAMQLGVVNERDGLEMLFASTERHGDKSTTFGWVVGNNPAKVQANQVDLHIPAQIYQECEYAVMANFKHQMSMYAHDVQLQLQRSMEAFGRLNEFYDQVYALYRVAAVDPRPLHLQTDGPLHRIFEMALDMPHRDVFEGFNKQRILSANALTAPELFVILDRCSLLHPPFDVVEYFVDYAQQRTREVGSTLDELHEALLQPEVDEMGNEMLPPRPLDDEPIVLVNEEAFMKIISTLDPLSALRFDAELIREHLTDYKSTDVANKEGLSQAVNSMFYSQWGTNLKSIHEQIDGVLQALRERVVKIHQHKVSLALERASESEPFMFEIDPEHAEQVYLKERIQSYDELEIYDDREVDWLRGTNRRVLEGWDGSMQRNVLVFAIGSQDVETVQNDGNPLSAHLANELQIHRQLFMHPRLVRVVGVFDEDDQRGYGDDDNLGHRNSGRRSTVSWTRHIITERLEGFLPLSQMFRNCGYLGGQENQLLIRYWGYQLLELLVSLHREGVVVRNLTPDQILVSSDGTLLKLVSLSCMGLVDTHGRLKTVPDMPDPTLDQANTPKESAQEYSLYSEKSSVYLPPEWYAESVFRHTQAYDTWNFGSLLYEMLFGRAPPLYGDSLIVGTTGEETAALQSQVELLQSAQSTNSASHHAVSAHHSSSHGRHNKHSQHASHRFHGGDGGNGASSKQSAKYNPFYDWLQGLPTTTSSDNIGPQGEAILYTQSTDTTPMVSQLSLFSVVPLVDQDGNVIVHSNTTSNVHTSGHSAGRGGDSGAYTSSNLVGSTASSRSMSSRMVRGGNRLRSASTDGGDVQRAGDEAEEGFLNELDIISLCLQVVPAERIDLELLLKSDFFNLTPSEVSQARLQATSYVRRVNPFKVVNTFFKSPLEQMMREVEQGMVVDLRMFADVTANFQEQVVISEDDAYQMSHVERKSQALVTKEIFQQRVLDQLVVIALRNLTNSRKAGPSAAANTSTSSSSSSMTRSTRSSRYIDTSNTSDVRVVRMLVELFYELLPGLQQHFSFVSAYVESIVQNIVKLYMGEEYLLEQIPVHVSGDAEMSVPERWRLFQREFMQCYWGVDSSHWIPSLADTVGPLVRDVFGNDGTGSHAYVVIRDYIKGDHGIEAMESTTSDFFHRNAEYYSNMERLGDNLKRICDVSSRANHRQRRSGVIYITSLVKGGKDQRVKLCLDFRAVQKVLALLDDDDADVRREALQLFYEISKSIPSQNHLSFQWAVCTCYSVPTFTAAMGRRLRDEKEETDNLETAIRSLHNVMLGGEDFCNALVVSDALRAVIRYISNRIPSLTEVVKEVFRDVFVSGGPPILRAINNIPSLRRLLLSHNIKSRGPFTLQDLIDFARDYDVPQFDEVEEFLDKLRILTNNHEYLWEVERVDIAGSAGMRDVMQFVLQIFDRCWNNGVSFVTLSAQQQVEERELMCRLLSQMHQILDQFMLFVHYGFESLLINNHVVEFLTLHYDETLEFELYKVHPLFEVQNHVQLLLLRLMQTMSTRVFQILAAHNFGERLVRVILQQYELIKQNFETNTLQLYQLDRYPFEIEVRLLTLELCIGFEDHKAGDGQPRTAAAGGHKRSKAQALLVSQIMQSDLIETLVTDLLSCTYFYDIQYSRLPTGFLKYNLRFPIRSEAVEIVRIIAQNPNTTEELRVELGKLFKRHSVCEEERHLLTQTDDLYLQRSVISLVPVLIQLNDPLVNQLLFNSGLISQAVIMYERYVLQKESNAREEYVDLDLALKRAEQVDYVATARRGGNTRVEARTSKRAQRMAKEFAAAVSEAAQRNDGTFGAAEAYDDTVDMREQAKAALVRECEHCIDRICEHEYALRTRKIASMSMLPNDFGIRHPELMEYFNTKGRYENDDEIVRPTRTLLDVVSESNVSRSSELLSSSSVWEGSMYVHPRYFFE